MNPAADIIPFPSVPGARPTRLRATVRFHVRCAPPKQLRLPLSGEPTLDQRIQSAKAAASGYQDLLCLAKSPATRKMLSGLMGKWEARTLELIAERDRLTAQANLPTL